MKDKYSDKYVGGTAFYINKSGGYADDEKPVIITAGHNFRLPDHTDISDGYIHVYVNYENEFANDPRIHTGRKITGTKLLKPLGTSYNVDQNSSLYIENNDYAILQSRLTSGKLRDNYDVLPAAWTIENMSPYDQGYFLIGHPNGDAKKLCVEPQNAVFPPHGNHFSLYYDFGVPEKGFSGGPVFDNAKRIVGWHCTLASGASCLTKGYDKATAGFLKELYSDISEYIDPESKGYSENATDATPLHCYNCVKDNNETGIDCGGVCPQCISAKESLTVTSSASGILYGENEVLVENSKSDDFIEISGNTLIMSKKKIIIRPKTKIQAGSDMFITSDNIIDYRECGRTCINLGNVFTPNSDGLNDFWSFSHTNIIYYGVVVYARDGTEVFRDAKVVKEDGIVHIWGGPAPGTKYYVNGNVFYYIIEGYDCYGLKYSDKSHITMFIGGKSGTVNDSLLFSDNENVCSIYPNPANDYLYVALSDEASTVDYEIYNYFGELVENGCIDSYSSIDLQNYIKGSYLIRIEYNELYQIEKFIVE